MRPFPLWLYCFYSREKESLWRSSLDVFLADSSHIIRPLVVRRLLPLPTWLWIIQEVFVSAPSLAAQDSLGHTAGTQHMSLACAGHTRRWRKAKWWPSWMAPSLACHPFFIEEEARKSRLSLKSQTRTQVSQHVDQPSPEGGILHPQHESQESAGKALPGLINKS